ncbi:TPA: 50S ribosomal protein L16 [Candidatus Acetothermia bacterium]|nr:50S ribosomal protein L16 [Candidatus Acetothermia bacterium]HAZ30660.1 50S ribosomal protein L16 [Candidatus Acetothermia bacterium]
MPALFPKRTKYRKQHRGRMKGLASRGVEVSFGEFGIQALAPAWITSQQIEAVRTALARGTHRGRVWVRIFPDKPYTKKAAESRMGKGKGEVVNWVAVVRPGRVMFEFAGVTETEAKEIHRRVSCKLPIPTQLRARFQLGGEK